MHHPWFQGVPAATIEPRPESIVITVITVIIATIVVVVRQGWRCMPILELNNP
jgi:hypothetical protein